MSVWVGVQEIDRPAAVRTAVAVPATDGIEVTWTIGAGEAQPDFRIDRRTGTGDWVRISDDVLDDHFADTTASRTQPSTYRVVPVSGGGEDLTGAMSTGPATPQMWSPPAGATTVASVDGMGLVPGNLTVTRDSTVIADRSGRLPGLRLGFPRFGLRVGTYPLVATGADDAHACRMDLRYPTGCAPITGTITVTRIARQADGTPVDSAAILSGTTTVNGVTGRTSALMVLGSVVQGLPAYVVADPAVLSTPLVSGMDLTLPVSLRNVGGSTGSLTTADIQATQKSAWSLTSPCTGVSLTPGAACTARVRVAGADLYPVAMARWQGSGGLVAGVSLDGHWQDTLAAPTLTLAAPA